jgi:hypothetical protein
MSNFLEISKRLKNTEVYTLRLVSTIEDLLERKSGQSSWLQIQRPRFDSRRYHIF